MNVVFDKVRQDFPILTREVYNKPLVYFDNAASAQKPSCVIEEMQNMMQESYANVHRGLHYLSNEVTNAFEEARHTVKEFINAQNINDIIFTSGATDSINLIAHSFVAPRLKPGDEIILSVMEHHSNIVPWHFLRERYGAVLKWIPCLENGQLDLQAYRDMLNPKTKFVAITQMSNVLGVKTPLDKVIDLAHQQGVQVLVDGCQGIVHGKADMQALDCDFYVFSSHKLYGPTGLGVAYAKTEYLEQMRPFRGGGEMIQEVTQELVTYADPPHRFEAGTPAIIESVGLMAAIRYIQNLGHENIIKQEAGLLAYATERMQSIEGLTIYGNPESLDDKGSIISFGIDKVHPHDLAVLIDREGVAIRAGHHCAQPLMSFLNVPSLARCSLSFYNHRDEIDIFIDALHKSLGILR